MNVEGFGKIIQFFKEFFSLIEKLPGEVMAILIPVLSFLAILGIRRVVR